MTSVDSTAMNSAGGALKNSKATEATRKSLS